MVVGMHHALVAELTTQYLNCPVGNHLTMGGTRSGTYQLHYRHVDVHMCMKTAAFADAVCIGGAEVPCQRTLSQHEMIIRFKDSAWDG